MRASHECLESFSALPREVGWEGWLDLANEEMLELLQANVETTATDTAFPLRLICQRLQHTYTSSGNDVSTNRGRGYNPAHMHPDDLDALGLAPGQEVEITSRRASRHRPGDEGLRPGLVAMAHGFGSGPELDGLFRDIGSPTGRLLDIDDVADPFKGMLRMSNIPIRIRARV